MQAQNAPSWETLLKRLDEVKRKTDPPPTDFEAYLSEGYLYDAPSEAYARIAFIITLVDNLSAIELLKMLDRNEMIEIEHKLYDGTTAPDEVVERLGKMGLEVLESGNMKTVRNLAMLTGYVLEYGVGKLFSPVRLLEDRVLESDKMLEAAVLATEFANPDFILLNHDENDELTLEEFKHVLLSTVNVIPWAEERLAPRSERKFLFSMVYATGAPVVLSALMSLPTEKMTDSILKYAEERYKDGKTVKDAFSESRLLAVALFMYADL